MALMARCRPERAEQLARSALRRRPGIFDSGNGTSHRPRIARQHALCELAGIRRRPHVCACRTYPMSSSRIRVIS
jgi:hypothetical protein